MYLRRRSTRSSWLTPALFQISDFRFQTQTSDLGPLNLNLKSELRNLKSLYASVCGSGTVGRTVTAASNSSVEMKSPGPDVGPSGPWPRRAALSRYIR